MATITEIEAIKELEKTLSSLEGAEVRKRVLDWACSKFSPASKTDPLGNGQPIKQKGKRSIVRATKRPGRARRTSFTIVKDVSLSPKDKESFKDFFKRKQPKKSKALDICALAVYYLKKEVNVPKVTANHVYSCFKDIGKPVPANLENYLPVISKRKGWIDTRDMDDIKLTVVGENYVEHKLPPKDAALAK